MEQIFKKFTIYPKIWIYCIPCKSGSFILFHVIFKLNTCWYNMKRENQQDATNSMFIIKLSISTCFRHHYAHHQQNKMVSYCMWCSAWVCRLWLAVVLWSCVVSCVHCVKQSNSNFHTVHTAHNAAPWAVCTVWNSQTVTSTQCTQLTMQLHKTMAYTPRQNTACSRTRSYSLGDEHNDARNMLR